LALLLTAASLGFGQGVPDKLEKPSAKDDKAPAKAKLEDLLAKALRDNPDIRVAAAKLAEADAELNRARLQVAQKVIAAHHALEAAQAEVEAAQKDLARLERLNKTGVAREADVDGARRALVQAKGKLAEAEAGLSFLLGAAPQRGVQSDSAGAADHPHFLTLMNEAELRRRYWLDLAGTLPPTATEEMATLLAHRPKGDLADKLRKALDAPVTVNYKGKTGYEVLRDLLGKAEGVPVVEQIRRKEVDERLSAPLDLQMKQPLPLGAALQLLEDQTHENLRLLVREYGVLVTDTFAMPRGALLLQDFWKAGKARGEPADGPRGTKNPPPEGVEGTVKKVDEASGLVMISLGSDAGLMKGHTLEVFRLGTNPKEAKYLGTVKVVEVSPTEAVCQPTGRLADKAKVGDHVASRIIGN
jgi:hypothetical protein